MKMGRKGKKRKLNSQKKTMQPAKSERVDVKTKQEVAAQIKIELGFADGEYKTTAGDGTNALVLPSKRQKEKKKNPAAQPIPKKLSKTKRKRLEKIVQQKEKKGKVRQCFIQITIIII